jgi:ATP-dependent Lon protease
MKAVKTKLPVFPLPGVVLMPNSVLPLHIFEMKYRQMLSDVLSGGKRFVVMNSQLDEGSASLGCVAELIKVEKLSDGRSNILTVGRERVKIVKYFSDKPYLTADVEFVKDEQLRAQDTRALSGLRTDLAQLTSLVKKVYKRDIDSILQADVSAEELSFIAAGLLALEPCEQQQVIDTTRTSERIKLLKPNIDALSKQLAALAAIENAFPSGS